MLSCLLKTDHTLSTPFVCGVLSLRCLLERTAAMATSLRTLGLGALRALLLERGDLLGEVRRRGVALEIRDRAVNLAVVRRDHLAAVLGLRRHLGRRFGGGQQAKISGKVRQTTAIP